MRALLASLAAAAAILPAPATAVDIDQMGFAANHGVSIHSGDLVGRPDTSMRRDRRDRRNDGTVFYDDYREYQGDTVWRSDSFNDWWHDRPDRAYPHWMLSNQNCDRMWWGGGTWRC